MLARTAASLGGKVDLECDLQMLGAGPEGGYSAAFRASHADLRSWRRIRWQSGPDREVVLNFPRQPWRLSFR